MRIESSEHTHHEKQVADEATLEETADRPESHNHLKKPVYIDHV